MDNAISTTHKLDFESLPYSSLLGNDLLRFRIGSCEGLWGCTSDSYFILSVFNHGNGHLDDVFEWFEFAAKRDGKNLMVLECFNQRFYRHLCEKRDFKPLDADRSNCIKVFNETTYQTVLAHGNEILRSGSLRCM